MADERCTARLVLCGGSDGTLEVGLRGETPRDWKQSFERTVDLLRGGDWGEVKLKKGRVSVGEIADSDEDRLRHFLESVVLQANAACGGQEPEAGEDQDEHEDKPNGPDAEMTERFRSFAADSETDGSEN